MASGRRLVPVFTAAVAMSIASCGGGSPAAPSRVPPIAHFTVSGTVFEIAGNEKRPIAGATIDRVIEQNGSVSVDPVATADAEGRYSLQQISAGTRLALVVRGRLQPCAAVATVAGNTVLDIDVLRGILDPVPRISPALSGRVFYAVNGERRPYTDGAGISFYSSGVGNGHVRLALAVTDDAGRFELCRLPLGPATLSINTHETNTATQVNLQGDLTVEIEVPAPVLLAAHPSRVRAVSK